MERTPESRPIDMPKPSGNTEQITLRIPKDWMKDAETLAKALSKPGLEVSKTDAIRVALGRGLPRN